MDDQTLLRKKFDIKELELNSLLEITQAINNNLPEDSLYKIYNFTLRANLSINKLALYVYEESKKVWECKTWFGTEKDYSRESLPTDFLEIRETSELANLEATEGFDEFDTIIPVIHNDRLLAFVLAGGPQTAVDNPNASTTFIQALSNIIIVAIENKKLARKQLRQEAIRKEMEIAREVQQFLFPSSLPNTKGLKVFAEYQPHFSVGGDYYDYIEMQHGAFLVCVADVSGKGVPAALLMSNFQAGLRTLARQSADLKTIVSELNFQILQSAHGENFITFFAATYDPQTRKLHYVNAGHVPPMLINHASGTVKQLKTGTLILGSFHPLPFLEVGVEEDLDEFLLFTYTDGLTETFNREQEEYGIDRLQEFLGARKSLNINELHEQLFRELEDFSGSQAHHDDITLLTLTVNRESLQQETNTTQ